MSNVFVGTIQIKGKTTSEWLAQDPILLPREPALDTSTGQVKYGDGRRWSDTPYPPSAAGVTTYAALSDAITAPIATTNNSVSGALAGKLPSTAGSVPLASVASIASKTYLGRTSAATGALEAVPVATMRTDLGILDAVNIAYSTTIPLDNAAGKRMPQTSITTNTTLVLGASPITDGYCELVIVGDGTHTFAFPSDWTRVVGSAPNMAANKRSYIGVTYLAIGEVVYSVTALSDVPAGLTFVSAQVANATPSVPTITMSGAIGATIPAAGDITLTGLTGVSVSSVAKSGSDLQITVSPALTWQSAGTIAVASGKVSNAGAVLSLASGPMTLVNNITMPVPGVPASLVAGTAGTTTVPLTWTAPVVNATQGTVADYVIEWRTSGVGGYSIFADGTSTTPSTTVTGLTSGTAYDFRVTATNATGSGAASSILTTSTTSSRITFTDSFTGADGSAPNARWTPREAGWTIQGNALTFNGSSFGEIFATCSAGDNTFSADASMGGSSYMYMFLRFVDDSNYVAVIRNSATTDKLTFVEVVAGVTNQSIAESGTSNLTCNLSISNVGSAISVKVDGVSIISATCSALSSATKVGLGVNLGHPTYTFDNVVLA